MIPISQAARRFGLSRSTLLHYDRIGLVTPSYRTTAGFRLYQEEELCRLEQICLYRKTGLSLEQIRSLLEPGIPEDQELQTALKARLSALNAEISVLRRQQQVTLQLLGDRADTQGRSRVLDKVRWVQMLRDAGMNDAEMMEWHRHFERRSPEAHQDFLESLGLASPEIIRIRKESR